MNSLSTEMHDYVVSSRYMNAEQRRCILMAKEYKRNTNCTHFQVQIQIIIIDVETRVIYSKQSH